MKAISIRQPWAWAILHGGKSVENRDWVLPRQFQDTWLWLHCGKRVERAAWYDIREIIGADPPQTADMPTGAVIGVVRFSHSFVTGEPDPMDTSPWYQGGVGWVVSGAYALSTPVPCKGRLKLWEPDEMDGALEKHGDVVTFTHRKDMR